MRLPVRVIEAFDHDAISITVFDILAIESRARPWDTVSNYLYAEYLQWLPQCRRF